MSNKRKNNLLKKSKSLFDSFIIILLKHLALDLSIKPKLNKDTYKANFSFKDYLNTNNRNNK